MYLYRVQSILNYYVEYKIVSKIYWEQHPVLYVMISNTKRNSLKNVKAAFAILETK